MKKLLNYLVVKLRNLLDAYDMSFAWKLKENLAVSSLKGEIFVDLRDGRTGEILETRHIKNVITRDMSILVARLLRNNNEPLRGLSMLAVGTGDVGWNPMSPPAATNTQRSLYNEITRKPFATVSFVDAGGLTSLIPTNVVDFTTTFSETEAVGPLVEMALLGGDANPLTPGVRNPILPANGVFDPSVDVVSKDQICNYLTFPVINKPATAVLTLTWRITT